MATEQTIGSIIAASVKESGQTKRDIATALGVTRAVLDRTIKDEGSPSVNRAVHFLDFFGYKLVAVKEGSELPEESFIIQETED